MDIMGYSSIVLPPSQQTREAEDNNPVQGHPAQASKCRDDQIAAVSSCPVVDCGSLVIAYSPADSVRPGHPEDWEFTCSRCCTDFAVTQGELIFQSIPKRWLSRSPDSGQL